MDSKVPNDIIVKDEVITGLILLQNVNDENHLSGILLLKRNKALYIKSGDMNFESTSGGYDILIEFKKWLDSKNIIDISLEYINDSIADCHSINLDKFVHSENNLHSISFEKWVLNEYERG
jgi:hypothetical protein